MNPTPEQIAVVYDFENVLESGLKTLFETVQIKAFTTQDFGATKDDGNGNQVPVIDFKKDRPRAEIGFVTGAGQGQFRPIIVDGTEVPVETSFKGRYTLDIFTAPDIKIHSAYRTYIRYFMHTKLIGLNGVAPMTLHKIQNFQRDSGTSPIFKSEDGYMRSTLVFDIDFSIQDEAWETIAS